MAYATRRTTTRAVPATRTRSVETLLSGMSDEALVMEFKAGREAAFDALYLRYRDRIQAYCRQLLRDSSQAEEVYNTTMFRVHAKLNDVEHPEQFRSYLYRAAYHSCLNANRRDCNLKRTPPGGRVNLGTVMPASDEADPETRLSSWQLLSLTKRYLDMLPEERRTAITLFHNDGLSYQEIAQALNRPIGTVRWLIHEARGAMARNLEGHVQMRSAVAQAA